MGDRGGRTAEHRVLVADDATREFQRLIAVILLCGGHRAVEDFAGERRGGGRLEIGDQSAGRGEAVRALVVDADIGGLQREIDSPGRAVRRGQAA